MGQETITKQKTEPIRENRKNVIHEDIDMKHMAGA